MAEPDVGLTDQACEPVVVAARFPRSGRVVFCAPGELPLASGDWVVAEQDGRRDVGQVVAAPDQVRLNLLDGGPGLTVRRLTERDAQDLAELRRSTAAALANLAAQAGKVGLPLRILGGAYEGIPPRLTVYVAAEPAVELDAAGRALAEAASSPISVVPLDISPEQAIFGALGKAGRTGGQAVWLPIGEDRSGEAEAAGTELGTEHERYRAQKGRLPRLGQRVETGKGAGIVVALDVKRAEVTVRRDVDSSEDVVGWPVAADTDRREGE